MFAVARAFTFEMLAAAKPFISWEYPADATVTSNVMVPAKSIPIDSSKLDAPPEESVSWKSLSWWTIAHIKLFWEFCF